MNVKQNIKTTTANYQFQKVPEELDQHSIKHLAALLSTKTT